MNFNFPDIRQAKQISLDVETFDPNLKAKGPGTFRNDGWLVGLALKPNDHPGFYIPIGHETGNIAINKVKPYLREMLGTDIPKIGANLVYDLEWLNWLGVKVQGKKIDVQVAEALIDENRFKYNLESIAQRRLGTGKLTQELIDACRKLGYKIRKDRDIFLYLHKLPPELVGKYCLQDVCLPEQIFEQQKIELAEQELFTVFNLESKLIDVLLKMRIKGVPVDTAKAEQVQIQLLKNEKQLHKQLNQIAGYEVAIWAAENIAPAFDKLGIVYPRTPKTKAPSFTAPWLEEHPSRIAQLLLKTRKIGKLRTDFVENMILGSVINGRIHPQFHSVKHDNGGTGSGRFSASNPNLQQVPSRDLINGPLIRGMFIPEHGCRWCKGDYSQQEPRVTIHYAALKKFKNADIAVQRYIDNPDTDYHQMVADLCSIERRPAKDINLGLVYGMGIPKMALKLGKTLAETKELFLSYHAGVPFVKQLIDNCTQVATVRGYIKTILGRRRHFDLWSPNNYNKDNPLKPLPYDQAVLEYGLPLRRAFTYKALNSLIQGTSAEMIKIAMINLDELGYTPHVTVHDEVDDSIETDKQGAEIKEVMMTAIKLKVPLKVDLFIEDNWGACK